MKRNRLFFLCLFTTIFLLTCTATRNYNFSLKNTLAIFLLNDGKDYYFSIPIQYIGNYQIEDFEFKNGFILIGGYEILLNRDDMNIGVFEKIPCDENGNTDGPDLTFNQYNIILEKYLKDSEIENITKEYEKGNVGSKFYLEYMITIDNEQAECGYSDDFELDNGPVQDFGSGFPPNLGFFRAKVLEKTGK
jgi:hypothetical protein